MRMRKRWKNKKGETLIETMIALMIVVLALTILAGGILSAGKMNSKVSNQEKAVTFDEKIEVPGASVNILHEDGNKNNISVNMYKTSENKGYYIYYKK